MVFTAKDLRYNLEKYYPALNLYLRHRAERALGKLSRDSDEVEQVVGHVIEHLVRVGLLGGGDLAAETPFDRMTTPQFYKFLNRSIKNKAIDRQRKRRLLVSTVADMQALGDQEEEYDPLNEVIEPVWSHAPFSTPEEATIELASQEELRNLLKECIEQLSSAPRQYEAVLQELQEFGALELLQVVVEDLHTNLPVTDVPLSHLSQHKDHAHKKIRHCVQKRSPNLVVQIALRITEYSTRSHGTEQVSVDVVTLAQDDLTLEEVRKGLKLLVFEGLLDWRGENVVRCSVDQLKRLARFYEEE